MPGVVIKNKQTNQNQSFLTRDVLPLSPPLSHSKVKKTGEEFEHPQNMNFAIKMVPNVHRSLGVLTE